MSTPTSPTRSSVRETPFPYREQRPTRAQTDTLQINFFPAELSADRVSVFAGRWTSPEDMHELETANPGLTTWRDPEDGSRVYAWFAADSNAGAPPGFAGVTVAHDESPRLFQRLMLDAVNARLRELTFVEKGGGWVNYEGGTNLLGQVAALSSAASSESIGIYAKVMVDGYFTKTSDGRLVSGIIVDVLYTTRMDVAAAEWVAAGIGHELSGVYVKLIAATPEAERFPALAGSVIGRIATIRGTSCVLEDARDSALVELPLLSVAPEPTRWNLTRYLLARHERAYQSGERQLLRNLNELVRPKTRRTYAEGLVTRRLQAPDAPGLALLPGVTFKLGSMSSVGPDTFPARRLNNPEFSFDPAGEKFARRVDAGLQQHGPYDAPQRQRCPFRILVVAPADNKGDASVAVQKLLAGVKTRQNVFTGLKGMYRLTDLSVTQAIIEPRFGATMKGYSEAYRRALSEAPAQPSGDPKFHLVLTVIRSEHQKVEDSENPYYQMKGLVLTCEHVPTQAIFVEKLRQKDFGLQYILNTMALAIYAKLGGTSHVLKVTADSDGSSRTELIFGIGRDIRKSSRFGRGEETIGFATVFRANGEYLYNDCTPYCSGDEYERALETTIKRTVESVAAFEQLEDGAKVRLVFHVPRRAGQREERAIVNAVGKLARFEIDFAIVHINDDHHLLLFDTANHAPRSRTGADRPEAAFLPQRGWSVTIGPRERLVTFVGPDQYRGNGSPSPIRVTLDKRSTFKDLDYLTQQMYSMSFMSVRSLTPGIEPVTISYAKRLAHLTGRLRGVTHWTVELIQEKLSRKLWFP